MATNTDGISVSSDSWSVLTSHDWGGLSSIESSVSEALAELEGTSTDVIIYDHVDLEAVTETLDPQSPERGASEVRFPYGQYEIRVARDGTIAAR